MYTNVNEYALTEPPDESGTIREYIIKVGDMVYDSLTRMPARIVRIAKDEFLNHGIWLDSEWADGARFPWEISYIGQEITSDHVCKEGNTILMGHFICKICGKNMRKV